MSGLFVGRQKLPAVKREGDSTLSSFARHVPVPHTLECETIVLLSIVNHIVAMGNARGDRHAPVIECCPKVVGGRPVCSTPFRRNMTDVIFS